MATLQLVVQSCCLLAATGNSPRVSAAFPARRRKKDSISTRIKPVELGRKQRCSKGRLLVQVKEVEAEEEEQCELVNGWEVTVGESQAYFVQALNNNNGLGVVVLSDELGYLDSDILVFANELACFGYNVLLPDLFRGAPWTAGRDDAEYEAWRALHPSHRLEQAIDEARAWLNQELVGGSSEAHKLGLVGFSLGGGLLVETLARDEQGDFGAAAFFYGTAFDPALASKIRIPLLLISGDSDPACPVQTVRQLESAVPGSVAKVYPGRGHGFALRPSSMAEDADMLDAGVTLREWLSQHLVPADEEEEADVEVVGEGGLDF